MHRSLDAAIAPSVTVIQPNGGEVLYIGQQYEILWDAVDNVGIDSSVVAALSKALSRNLAPPEA